MTLLLAAAIAVLTLLFPSSANATPAPDGQPAPTGLRNARGTDGAGSDFGRLALEGSWEATLQTADQDSAAPLRFRIEHAPAPDGECLRLAIEGGAPAPIALTRRGDELLLAASPTVRGEDVELTASFSRGDLRGTLHVTGQRHLLPWTARRGHG